MLQPNDLEISIAALEVVNSRLDANERASPEALSEILLERSHAVARIERWLTVPGVTCVDSAPRLRRAYEAGERAQARLRDLRHDLARQWTSVVRANNALHHMLEDGRRSPRDPVAIDVRA